MEQSRKFTISTDRLMTLAMDLANLLHAHKGMCEWLGSYDSDQEDCCDAADFYKFYFEDRFGHLMLTLSNLLRTLDDQLDRELFKGVNNGLKDANGNTYNDLGVIRFIKGGKKAGIKNLRTVFNFVIHAGEVITNPQQIIIRFGDIPVREMRWLDESILIAGELHKKDALMELNLNKFCDMIFLVVEDLRHRA